MQHALIHASLISSTALTNLPHPCRLMHWARLRGRPQHWCMKGGMIPGYFPWWRWHLWSVLVLCLLIKDDSVKNVTCCWNWNLAKPIQLCCLCYINNCHIFWTVSVTVLFFWFLPHTLLGICSLVLWHYLGNSVVVLICSWGDLTAALYDLKSSGYYQPHYLRLLL